MKRIVHGFCFSLLAVAPALVAQLPAPLPAPLLEGDAATAPAFSAGAASGSFDGGFGEGGLGGAGQVEPAAYTERYLTRLAVRSVVSPLGTGGELATNLPYHIDLRAFGNYTNFDWKLNQSGFYIIVNIAMANTGAMVDYYPWKQFRLSPGFLLYNTDRVTANLQAGNNATFTLNNITYISDNANPVHGTGGITLGGRGFMATTGWGHIVSRNQKHWGFPFEAGVALIDKPVVSFGLAGDVCLHEGIECVPAATFPGFQSNLNTQLASWNKRVAPFHIYPILEGGISYTFRYRR